MLPRFVQPAPDLPDPYADDAVLRSWLDRLLGEAGHAAAQQRLKSLAAEVSGELRAAHADAEAHPPVLHRYDAWGARVDRIETAPGWERLRAAAAEHGVVGLPYRDEARAAWGAGARVVQHALLHLFGPESATFTCPVAMADGAAALLSRDDVDPAVRDAWLPRLISADAAVAVTSGQWMTESQGGSDVGRATTFALPAADGSWRLTGEKWFCSAADSAMAVALARPHGSGTSFPGRGSESDSRSLAPFLVPRYRSDGGPAQGLRLHRLKEKLGTRAVPTAEIGLTDAYAVPLGNPEGGGLARMMTLVVVTRLHNAAAAAAGMRRGLDYARAYARIRHVAGGPLDRNPLHRATLGTLAVDAQAAFALAAHSFALLGAAEVGGPDTADPAERELRLLAPLAKLTTGRLAVSSASEYLEAFGGAGYVEETGIPRLLRDAQVLPIWEGTTNVLSVDVLRAVRRDVSALAAVVERIDAAIETAIAHRLTGAVNGLHAARHRISEALSAVGTGNLAAVDEAVMAGSRGLALAMGYAVAAALLVEHAAATGAESAAVAAELWAKARLSGEDIAVDAHRGYEVLVG